MMTIERPPLTEKQAAVLAYLRERIREDGRPPTIREIGREFGISSPNGIVAHLKALAAKGYIEHDPMTARGIRIVKLPETRTEKVARLRRQLAEIEVELAAAIAEGES